MNDSSGACADPTATEVAAADSAAGVQTARKARIHALSNRLASERQRWRERAAYFHAEDLKYLRFLIPEGSDVLVLGSELGHLLAGLRPRRGTGIEISENMVGISRQLHPELEFIAGDIEDLGVLSQLQGPYDYIVVPDTIGAVDDVQAMLESLHGLCHGGTRIIISYYAYFWEPLLNLAETMGLKMPTCEQNVLSSDDIRALLGIADFEVLKREWRQLIPASLFGLGTLVNRYLGTLPGIRRFALRNFIVARSARIRPAPPQSATIVIPCRNERGNIEPAVQRLPRFCNDIELIYVEGHSSDGTYDEALRVQAAYPSWDIKVIRQDGVGKADAVFKAFDMARGDVLMILDADLTVPPEQLGKFWDVMASGKAEYVQGTRLVYPMEKQAMRFLNHIANWAFSVLFSWLLNMRITDTLCGTKVISRKNYALLKANQSYFGDFDPFGDFDLIFGAAKLNLKLTEIPIRYAARSYGETQISRFRHGVLLLRMVAFAYRKLKAF